MTQNEPDPVPAPTGGTGLGPLQLSAWRAVSQVRDTVYRAVADAMLTETGLPLEWYEVLVHLRESDGGGIRQTEIEERLPISPSGVSRMLTKMQDAGLVARSRVAHDRRALHVSITGYGAERAVRATPVYVRSVESAFGRHVDSAAAAAVVNALVPALGAATDTSREGGPGGLVSFGQTMLAVTSDAVSVADAIQVRNALEPQLLLSAARRVTGESAARLREEIVRMSSRLGDAEAYFRADWQLHRTLAQLCGNVTLRTMYLGLLDVIESQLEHVADSDDLDEYLKRRLVIHAQLVDAVISGEEERVLASARDHHFQSAQAPLAATAEPRTPG